MSWLESSWSQRIVRSPIFCFCTDKSHTTFNKTNTIRMPDIQGFENLSQRSEQRENSIISLKPSHSLLGNTLTLKCQNLITENGHGTAPNQGNMWQVWLTWQMPLMHISSESALQRVPSNTFGASSTTKLCPWAWHLSAHGAAGSLYSGIHS